MIAIPISTARFRLLRPRDRGSAAAKRRSQAETQHDEFIARRNAQYGKPGYDLKMAMKQRLQEIDGVDGY